MAAPRYPGFDTLALHAGQRPDPVTARPAESWARSRQVTQDAFH